ncbi:pyrroline-5-carboxylate reductase [Acuticoccus sp. M5D2P5]|uniref:pyrroline-5-carboxylate reductase n=1 Tax=Acuticoccus kalidii TaxID=2910977 RepID=UPI001F47C783|nr:pyrroline-5-carboxylate reductase [Acuticoccus kalidii]MCF3931872.1 pyrroline-5-carboxylate reductase [Acuticoccus kalidii]
MTPDRPLVLVGAGKMGGAMLEGWLASGIDPRTIVVIEPNPSDTQPLQTPGLRVVSEPPALVADTLVLAIKPQMFGDVLPSLSRLRDGETLVVSIAAGITIATLGTLGPGPIVRSIPNTPSSVGKGMTAAVGSGLSEAQLGLADKLLRGFGAVEWVEDEALIDAATAVSGSGPAYVFLMVEALTEAGIAEGLPADVAASLARNTIIGAGALLDRSSLDPATLRRNVTSPGGTTAAALDVLMEEGALEALMKRAVHAARVRSDELGS